MTESRTERRKWYLGIFPRVVLFSVTILSLVLGAFTVTIIKREERILMSHLESRAELLAASVDRVCANAIFAEEQWTVVEQFQKMVDVSSEVRYAVITKQADGDSIIFTKGAWRVETLDDEFWRPTNRHSMAFQHEGDIVEEKILHFAYPFSYESYEWGWIHVGMSLDEFNSSLNEFYRITFMLTVPALLFGLGLSFLFARNLTGPIAKLRTFALRIAGGNLDQRVTVKSRDELGDLAQALNRMAEDLTSSLKRDAELREKEILLKEIHHRVKNNMQILSSLLRLQARQTPGDEMQAFLKESESRIRSMGLIHEKLYQSSNLSDVDFKGYAETLTAELRRMYGGANADVKIRIDVEDVCLGLDTALPCGLILNELVSNSFKYAFPNGRSGEITVKMRSAADQKFEFVVEDNGIGLAAGAVAEREGSLGMRLISTLTRQINGELEINHDSGMTTKITFSESQYTERV